MPSDKLKVPSPDLEGKNVSEGDSASGLEGVTMKITVEQMRKLAEKAIEMLGPVTQDEDTRHYIAGRYTSGSLSEKGAMRSRVNQILNGWPIADQLAGCKTAVEIILGAKPGEHELVFDNKSTDSTSGRIKVQEGARASGSHAPFENIEILGLEAEEEIQLRKLI